MSINFSQASAARIDAARFESDANRQASVQVALFTQWLSAQTTENEKLAVFLREAFPEPLATATSDWLDERAVDAQSRSADAVRHAQLRARQRCPGRGKTGTS